MIAFLVVCPRNVHALVKAAVGPVLFIGDGENDAPALVAADCGISVLGAHACAEQTADLVVMRGGLTTILAGLAIARRTVTLIRQNMVLALVYNAVAVPAAMTGTISPVRAAVVMLISSHSVSANVWRIGRPAATISAPAKAPPHTAPAA